MLRIVQCARAMSYECLDEEEEADGDGRRARNVASEDSQRSPDVQDRDCELSQNSHDEGVADTLKSPSTSHLFCSSSSSSNSVRITSACHNLLNASYSGDASSADWPVKTQLCAASCRSAGPSSTLATSTPSAAEVTVLSPPGCATSCSPAGSSQHQTHQQGWLAALGIRCRSSNTRHLERSLRCQQLSSLASGDARATTLSSQLSVSVSDVDRYVCLERHKHHHQHKHQHKQLAQKHDRRSELQLAGLADSAGERGVSRSCDTSLDDESTHCFLSAAPRPLFAADRWSPSIGVSSLSLPEKSASSRLACDRSAPLSQCSHSVQVSPVSSNSGCGGLRRFLRRADIRHRTSPSPSSSASGRSARSRRYCRRARRRRRSISSSSVTTSSLERQPPGADVTPVGPKSSLEAVMSRAVHVQPCSAAFAAATSSSSTSGSGSGGGGAGRCHQMGEFINKPARGWLHEDGRLKHADGVSYDVQYVGRLEVRESMKSLSFETRSLVARECIRRVCECCAGGAPSRPPEQLASVSFLCECPVLAGSADETSSVSGAVTGVPVSLTINTSTLTLRDRSSGRSIAQHNMPNVSFASGGDPESKHFVAYVAKDSEGVRLCYVLDCGSHAQQVISTIGQAFELRYRHFLQRNGHSSPTDKTPVEMSVERGADERVYYNDLPGKIPPDVERTASTTGRPPPLDISATTVAPLAAAAGTNLIDLNTPPAGTVTCRHEYVNASTSETNEAAKNGAVDPFDMQPFDNCLPGDQSVSSTAAAAAAVSPDAAALPPEAAGAAASGTTTADHKRQLLAEPWFHGVTSRRSAEGLLKNDGDFLVRESQGAPGQFVLSGQHAGVKKHLLLVDPHGVVRTRDRTFHSVAHLIQYHQQYQLPIVSAETALTLRNAIIKH